jgi:uncharacterized protein (TIGR02186 family)
MAGWLRRLFLASLALAPIATWAGDEPLVVAPEKAEVKIGPGFAGSELQAVGAMEGPGDVIIKVVGPPQETRLSRERQLGPFWVGGTSVNVEGAPSLLFLFATAPIDSLLPASERERYGLVLEHVPVRIEPRLQAHAATDWRKAFFRLKERQGRYHEDDHAIRVFGDRLYIADMRLPDDLQVGDYAVETLLVKSGKVVARSTGHFKVRLAGMEHWVWDAAHDHAWLFGALFTLAAMLLGFALNAIPYRRAR